MDMQIDIALYEALTEVGVKPDSARRVERQLEAFIANGHKDLRAEMLDKLMTTADGTSMKADLKTEMAAMKAELKADIASLESKMLKGFNDLSWRMVTFVVAANAMMLAIFKYLG